MIKRTLLFVLVAVSLSACRAGTAPGEVVEKGNTPLGGSQIRYVHDEPHQVGCWFFIDDSGSSLSCLPDSQYTVK